MTTAAKKSRVEEKPEGFLGFIKNSYRKTMDASEKVSITAVNLPYMFLEGLGVPEERTRTLKGINEAFVGGVYKGTDWVTTRAAGAYIAPFKWVGNGLSRLAGRGEKKAKPKKAMKKAEAKKPEAKKAMKKAEAKKPEAKKAMKKAEAKKPAPKKAPKKAAKAKKEPPKVARRALKVKEKADVELAA